MAVDDPSAHAFARDLEATTERYLGQLGDCVGRLPALVEAYGEGDAYRPIVAEIETLESDCDETKRELSGLVANADAGEVGLRLTQIHLHADRLLELHGALDSIANGAEQFATELAAIGPARREACLDGMRRLAMLAVAAMAELDTAVTEFVRALCRPEYGASITAPVSSIRTFEGEADTVRNAILEAAFDGERDADALAYRQLAVLFDGVLDAMEDVTDQMHLMTGTEAWFDVEIYPDLDY